MDLTDKQKTFYEQFPDQKRFEQWTHRAIKDDRVTKEVLTKIIFGWYAYQSDKYAQEVAKLYGGQVINE